MFVILLTFACMVPWYSSAAYPVWPSVWSLGCLPNISSMGDTDVHGCVGGSSIGIECKRHVIHSVGPHRLEGAAVMYG